MDDFLTTAISDEVLYHGLCQLINKGDQPHPITIEGNQQVAIDQKWDALCYHRLDGEATNDPDEEQSFGRSMRRVFIQPMRMVVAHKVDKGEHWIYDFAQAFPESLEIEDDDGNQVYELIDIDNMSIITDQEAIYTQEFGSGDYEKHRIPWNIYAIQYQVRFIKC